MSLWPNWGEQKLYALLFGAVLGLLVIFLASESVYSIRQNAAFLSPVGSDRTITVDGSASVTVAPDVATIWFGVETEKETIQEAQEQNTIDTNDLLETIKSVGIPEEDIQTANYSVYEDTYWSSSTREEVSDGWIVSQRIEVTVRDLELISDVVSLAGSEGVTSLNGPNLTIEDITVYTEEARQEAIEEARTRADEIADALGLRVKTVVAYDEYSSGDDYYGYAEASIYGYGGYADSAVIESGTEEVSLNVTIAYRLGK